MSERPAAEESVPVLEQQADPAIPAPTPAPDAAENAQAGAPEAPPDSSGSERLTFQSMADRLTLGLLASVIGAVLVFISAFLTWSTVNARSSAGGQTIGVVTNSMGISGGRLGTATLVLSIAALAMVTVMLLPATKPWAWQVLIGFGLLSVFFTLIDVVSIPKTLRPDPAFCQGSGVSCTFPRSIGAGVWFTLIASLLIVAGAYVHHIRPVPFRAPGVPERPDAVDLTKGSAA